MHRTTLVFSILLCVTNLAAAQNPYVLETYGDGVHAFYRGEIDQACVQFDKAIRNGSRDPRVYYFRALMNLQSGDQGLADQDIRTGVMYELRGEGTWDIGMALARVQGPHRIQFEDARRDAKLELSGQPLQRPRSVQPYMDPAAIDDRPLADDLPLGPALGDDPFGDDESEDSDASDLNLDDSMSDESAPDELTDDAIEPPDDELPDPMDQPADDDPFGAEPDAGTDDPFGDSGDAAEENPFGDDMGADAAAPDAAADDPFADDPLEENPFE